MLHDLTGSHYFIQRTGIARLYGYEFISVAFRCVAGVGRRGLGQHRRLDHHEAKRRPERRARQWNAIDFVVDIRPALWRNSEDRLNPERSITWHMDHIDIQPRRCADRLD